MARAINVRMGASNSWGSSGWSRDRRLRNKMNGVLCLAALSLLTWGCSARPRGKTKPVVQHASGPPASTPKTPATEPVFEPGGAVFFLVPNAGVMRIGDDGVKRVVNEPLSFGPIPRFGRGAQGAVWLGGFDIARVFRLTEAGQEVRIELGREDDIVHRVAARAANDVWFTVGFSDWHVGHYDGTRAKIDRAQSDFPGSSHNNRLNDLVVTKNAVWLSCHNGLFRRDASGWHEVEAPSTDGPEPIDAPYDLFPTNVGLVVEYASAFYLRKQDTWQELSLAAITTLNPMGLGAGGSKPDALFAQRLGGTPPVLLNTVRGAQVRGLSVDRRGRVWVATDVGLSVVAPTGEVLRQWGPGELEGLTGEVDAVMAVGAGPAELPEVGKAVGRAIEGRIRLSKAHGGFGGAVVKLCNQGAASRRCSKATVTRRSPVEEDGHFRFENVPDGDFALILELPAGHGGCSGIFHNDPSYIAPATDCPAGSDPCDLGTAGMCHAFEHPPPRRP